LEKQQQQKVPPLKSYFRVWCAAIIIIIIFILF